MRVLIACESSGTVREAFRARGHDAWSADLLDSLTPGGSIELSTYKDDLFVPGQGYYVDFTPAD